MIHEFRSPYFVETPLGEGIALFVIDYGVRINTVWCVRLHKDGAVKHFDSNDIRVFGNPMWGIEHPKPFKKRER